MTGTNYGQILKRVIEHMKKRGKRFVGEEPNLMGFFLLKTASGRTKRRSLPLGTFQEVMHPPKRYISTSLYIHHRLIQKLV